MRSRILTITGLLFLSCLLFFCKKDNPSVEEGPFFDFFNESSITIDTVAQAADSWEYGFAFTPLKSGKITRLNIKLPATGTFTATLWDLSGPTPVVLRTTTVETSILSENAGTDIPEIALTKSRKYGITVLSNAFYRLSKPSNGPFLFPKTIGNIRIDSFNENVNNSSAPAFPTTTNDTRVAPCVNVIFIAD
jgi:hypothetical protein